MHLATPTCHDDVVGISASPLEPEPLPKRHCGAQVVA
jgi:hypothetical protein